MDSIFLNMKSHKYPQLFFIAFIGDMGTHIIGMQSFVF